MEINYSISQFQQETDLLYVQQGHIHFFQLKIFKGIHIWGNFHQSEI